MAIDVKKLQDKIGREADLKDIHKWINEAAMRGLTSNALEDYVKDKFYLSTLEPDELTERQLMFDKKWGETGNKMEELAIDKPKKPEKPVPAEDINQEVEADIIDTPDVDKPEETDDLSFENPDLDEFDDPESEEELLEPDLEPRPSILKKMAAYDEEFITRRVPSDEFDREMSRHMPFIDLLKDEPGILKVLAERQTISNHLPYDYAKTFLINNPLMDPNNRNVLMDVVDEERPDTTTRKYMPLPQCQQIAKNLAEQGFFQSALNDFSEICTEYDAYTRQLIYLIHNLQVQLESKQKAPFEFSIPKQILTQTIMESFEGIKSLITDQVIVEMTKMRSDLSGEMLDVGSIVEKNMKGFETQIAEAIDKVIWKVKTDVEETNLEDIKKSALYILNKRASTYQMGTGPLAVMTLMLDDLQRKIINQNFKLGSIREQRRYTIIELQRRLAHKRNTVVIKALPKLAGQKLVKLYGDKTFSL